MESSGRLLEFEEGEQKEKKERESPSIRPHFSIGRKAEWNNNQKSWIYFGENSLFAIINTLLR